MKKNILFFCSSILIFSGCNNAENIKDKKDPVTQSVIDTFQKKEDTVTTKKTNADTSYSNKIMGYGH